ncbi:hypothetical protein [Holdemanella biformis]|jgi:hypothetical protein|uniref:hypothetical protein n=1 Tax=Holdemanella biformis TaxID=1735 RepID=UPI0022DEBEE5|nr:hypothetical protein [Holdemanella biformis]
MSDTFIFKPNVKYEFNKKNNGIRVSETKKFILPKKTTLPYNMFVDRTVHKTRTPIKFEDEK